MKKILPFGWLIVLAAGPMLAGENATVDQSWISSYAPYGDLIVTQFASAPFPDSARQAGHTYHGQFYSALDHYSDSTVALFLPKKFHAGDHVDFVIHFHGWNHTVAGTIPEYKLIEQFAGGGKNAILIVPQGPYNAPDSFDGKLEATNGFTRFMDEAMAMLHSAGDLTNANAKIGTIILSGHSGGYHVMAAILNHGGLADKIREVWLFDALYGGAEDFVAWQKSEKGRLLDIYTDHGGTRQETENLMSSLKKQGVEFFAAEETNIMPGDLLTNRMVFLHTDMVHNDVVAKRRTFENFIKTSCLHDP
jgi:hypothetical protein